jgi:hypothetical protein
MNTTKLPTENKVGLLMEKRILKAIEEAYRKGLRDAKCLNDISPYLLTSQVVAQELANKFCQPLFAGRSEQLLAFFKWYCNYKNNIHEGSEEKIIKEWIEGE